MPPKRPSGTLTNSDSDSDAPEAVSLSSSRKVSEAQAKTIKLYESSQRTKRKNENRERDRLLKEEKARRLEVDDRTKELKGKERVRMATAEERMERAMRQAAEEGSEEDAEDEGESDDDDGDREERMEEDDKEEEWGGISNESDIAADPDITTKQLPDHIFAAAAISKSTINQSSELSENKSRPDKKKKKRKANRAKELIVGDRAIKVFSVDSPVGEAYQSPNITKFMKTQLQLHNQDVTVATTPSLTKRSGPAGRQKVASKGDPKSKGRSPLLKGWNRMPVNLGAMRRLHGPAKNFVRDASSVSTSRA